MDIIFHSAGANPELWQNALQQALPNANMRVWHEGDTAAADYALVWKPPAAMLRGRTDLKAIFNLGAGVDAILQLGNALPAGVPVIRLDDAGMGIQMAEFVAHAVLRYFRRLDDYAKQNQSKVWRFLTPYERKDFSIGVLGLGVLGNRIIDALRDFDFPINGWSRTQKNVKGVTCYAGHDQLDQFLRASKVLVVILPLTTETENLLDRTKLSQLPKGAYLINVARGAHLIETDLLDLIQDGHIAGATLDVFREEPLPPTHPFWQEPRISITPHISALTMRDESARQIAMKIEALQNGLPIVGLVDQQRGY
jgi:glyoxylate/hydroxypyruvate reductase A